MKKIIAFGVLFAPFIALAQGAPTTLGGVGTVDALIAFMKNALSNAVVILLALAVAYFLWGVAKFVMAAGDEDAQKVGRAHMIYGIIGIAVMVSMWGLVAFFTNSAQLGNPTSSSAPTITF